MATILYIETNFAIGVAKGQDPEAERFLADDSVPIRLVVPGLCFIEAFSAWNLEKKQRKQFIEQLKFHAREASRDQRSEQARTLHDHLERSRTETLALLDDIEGRLHRVIDDLSKKAEIIAVHRAIVEQAVSERIIEDMTDNLILWSIVPHARENPGPVKAFVSSNHQDFDRPDVQKALGQVGIKYFRRTEAALGWLGSSADQPGE